MSIELETVTPVEIKPPRTANNWRILSAHVDVENRRITVQLIRARKAGGKRKELTPINRLIEGADYTAFMQAVNPRLKNTLIAALKSAGDVPNEATEV